MMSYVLVEQAGQPQQAIEVLKQQMLTVSSEELQLHLAHAYRDYGSAAAYPQYAPSLQMAMMMYQAVLSQNPGCSDAKQVCSTCLLLPTSLLVALRQLHQASCPLSHHVNLEFISRAHCCLSEPCLLFTDRIVCSTPWAIYSQATTLRGYMNGACLVFWL